MCRKHLAPFLLTSAALAALALAPARAQEAADPVVELDDVVVSATRTSQEISTVPSSVSLLPLEDLATMQIVDLPTALSQETGVTVSNSGARGGQSSLFLRGASSHQTLFIVDGVRMNDRSAAYLNFLGGADLGGLGRVEVLRGPQSTLYGSSAMGGVIALETAEVGRGAPTGAVVAGAGSLDSWNAGLVARGGTPTLGYSVSVSREATANDRPQNDFKSWNFSGRLESSPAEAPLRFGATYRAQQDDYEEPGSTFYPSPGIVDSRNRLATAYVTWKASDAITSRLTLARHERDYAFTDPDPTYGYTSTSRNRRTIADWQTSWKVFRQAVIVGGANVEHSTYDINGATTRDDVGATFLSGTYRPVETVTLMAGARYDDFRSVGGATTWRTGTAWRIAPATRLHATYGTGFSAPGSDDRYGVGAWGQLPNPNLRPEKSRGWDLGLEHSFNTGAVTVGVTYFENRFRDLFAWQTVNSTTYEGMIVNLARAQTRGVETSVAASLASWVRGALSYTYLDARDATTGARLIRRPRHMLDASTIFIPARKWAVGAGLHVVAGRYDSRQDFTQGPIDDYATVRLFGSYQIGKNIALKVHLENALNKKYDDVAGYPALPARVFGSAEWRF